MVNLQAQLAYLKEQAAQQSFVNYNNASSAATTENPNHQKYFGKPSSTAANFPHHHDLQGWFQNNMDNYSNMAPQFLPNDMCNYNNNSSTTTLTQNCVSTTGTTSSTSFLVMDQNHDYENSFSSFDDVTNTTNNSNSMSYHMQAAAKGFHHHELVDADNDLLSVAFGFTPPSSS